MYTESYKESTRYGRKSATILVLHFAEAQSSASVDALQLSDVLRLDVVKS